jgi:hypothetical protein
MRSGAQDNKKNPRSYAGLAELAAVDSTRSARIDESGGTAGVLYH